MYLYYFIVQKYILFNKSKKLLFLLIFKIKVVLNMKLERNKEESVHSHFKLYMYIRKN
jgi:hypothetical protein